MLGILIFINLDSYIYILFYLRVLIDFSPLIFYLIIYFFNAGKSAIIVRIM